MYRIRNKKTGDYLKRFNGKTCWHTPAAAKNAWNADRPWNDRRIRFSQQDEWECIEVKLIPTGVIK
tara:strand:- start:196 stop:393 length:198 start_codon:yes stop_codon:yes gene_type:complete